jgi:hypothetical protein
LYQFRCLAFGLPFDFHQNFETNRKFFKETNLRLIIYLDDILILNSNAEGAGRDYLFAVSILKKCGFLINLEKLVGTPEQVIEYLGLIIESKSLSLSLRPEKIVEIIDLCGKALELVSVYLRDIAKILGNLAWAIKEFHSPNHTIETSRRNTLKVVNNWGDRLIRLSFWTRNRNRI